MTFLFSTQNRKHQPIEIASPTAPPPNGVGIQLGTVKKLIADDPEAERLYREATTASVGINQYTKEDNDNIITQKPKQGTSRAYTLASLMDQMPKKGA